MIGFIVDVQCFFDDAKNYIVKEPVSYTHLDVYKRQSYASDCSMS